MWKFFLSHLCFLLVAWSNTSVFQSVLGVSPPVLAGASLGRASLQRRCHLYLHVFHFFYILFLALLRYIVIQVITD